MIEKPYEAVTRGVIVRVRPKYLPEQSDPAARRWVWAYQIEIVNASTQTVTLQSRRWLITDGRGRVEGVEGPGVVGKQPTLTPGEAFSYVSGCPLATSSGSMVGTYRMTLPHGEAFDVAIPAFSLDVPEPRTVN
jgi:ApaG protein